MTSGVDIVYVIDLNVIYNFLVNTLFLWLHRGPNIRFKFSDY
jgi:hypothetical protein